MRKVITIRMLAPVAILVAMLAIVIIVAGCEEPPANPTGVACTTRSDCAIGLICATVQGNKQCTAIGNKQDGSPCASDMHCAGGRICVLVDASQVCILTNGDLGQPCQEDTHCQGDLYCDAAEEGNVADRACRARRAATEPCETHRQCASELGLLCTAVGAGSGGTCSVDIDEDNAANAVDVDDDGDGLIEIRTIEEFNNIRYNLAGTSYDDEAADDGANAGDATGCAGGACNGYELSNDIDLGDTPFVPIGARDGGARGAPFTGTFEGNNHTISRLTIDGNWTELGLFARLDEDGGDPAAVRNIHLDEVRINRNGHLAVTNTCAASNTACVGALAGWADANIDNVRVTAALIKGGDNLSYLQVIGGLIGMTNGGMITNVSVSGEVERGGNLSDSIGGLIGMHVGGSIEYALASVSVSNGGADSDNLGGLIGENNGGDIAYASALGAVSDGGTGSDNLGGLIGENNGGDIAYAAALGAVSDGGTGSDNLGGLIGRHDGENIMYALAVGAVSGGGAGSDNLGGLIGLHHVFGPDADGFATFATSDSMALGSVEGDAGTDSDYVGGLMGYVEGAIFMIDGTNESDSNVLRNYALGRVSGDSPFDSTGGMAGSTLDLGQPDLDSKWSGYWDTETTGQINAIGDPRINELGIIPLMLTPLEQITGLDSARFTGFTNAMPGDLDTSTVATDWIPATEADRNWDLGMNNHYPGLIFKDADGDQICIIRPMLIAATEATAGTAATEARFSLEISESTEADTEVFPCADISSFLQ